MLREGLQETEARVFLERALREGSLDESLAAEVRGLLTELYNIRYHGGSYNHGGPHVSTRRGANFVLFGRADYPQWIDLTSKLYDTAARVTSFNPEAE